MNAADLLLAFVRSGAVLGVALLVALAARRLPALRVAALRLGLAAALALTFATPFLRERPAPVRWMPAVAVDWTPPARSVPVAPAPEKPKPTPVATSVALDEPTFDPVALLPGLYLTGAALLALRLMGGYVALARVRRGCVPLDLPELPEIARSLGIAPPRVVAGEAVAAPFVAGVLRPTVYLPADWSVDEEIRVAILRHETAHLAHGDLRWGLIRRIAEIVLWPQPLVWLFARPLAVAGEILCDGQVLASGMPRARYADGLLALRATGCPRLGIGAVGRSGLAHRVEAILADVRPRRLSPLTRTTVRLGALALAGIAALLFARPTPLGSPAQSTNAVQGPYAGRVHIVAPYSKPEGGARAWLILNDGSPGRPLRVEGGDVVLPEGIRVTKYINGVLAVRAAGSGIGFVRLWPAPKRVETLVLPAPVALSGRVLLPDGRPAAGLRVRATQLGREKEFLFLLMARAQGIAPVTTTDAAGRFTLTGLPPDCEATVDVEDARYAHGSMQKTVPLKARGENVAPDLRLRFAATVRGHVTRDGRPIAGLMIGAQATNDSGGRGWGDATTDRNGDYVMGRLPAGEYNVIVGLRPPLSDERTAVAHEKVRVKAGETKRGLDFRLIRGALVQGRVTDLAGRPLAEVQIGVYGPAHPNSSAWVQGTQTDTHGRYRLRVPGGKQYVYLADAAYEGPPRTLTVKDGTTTNGVDFEATPEAPEAPSPLAERESPADPESDDSKSVGPVASFGPGKPFYGPVRLENGGTVRLAYVQDDAVRAHTLWRPDGSSAAPGDVRESLNMKGFAEGEGPRRMFARLEESGLPRGETDHVVQVAHPSNWTVYQSYGDSENRSGDLLTFHAPKDLRTTDVRVGIAAGPWKTVRSGAPGSFARMASRQEAGSLTGSVAITVEVPPALEGKNVSVAAFQDGRPLELAAYETETHRDPKTGRRTRTFSFQGDSGRAVERVDLLVRDYEWVTFRGVRLQPNAHP